MINTNDLLKLLEDKEAALPLEFDVLFHGRFRLDNRAKQSLNKTLDTASQYIVR